MKSLLMWAVWRALGNRRKAGGHLAARPRRLNAEAAKKYGVVEGVTSPDRQVPSVMPEVQK